MYQRVSTDTQRERETIKTQHDALGRAIIARPEVDVVDTYVDDGVSGTTLFALRPGGARLLADAARGLFEEVWVFRFDRVGRDEVDALVLRRDLQALGVALYSVTEGEAARLTFGIHMLMAAEERQAFRTRSAEGMSRAAREGRYCGGIVPYGYQVEGHKNNARLVPAEDEIPGSVMSQAQTIRHIYERLARDGWTCRQIANELNALAVPTRYSIDGRGMRGRATQGRWGAGRIRNMVVNPIYRGEQQYGCRSEGGREVITAEVPALVTEEIWHAAQETLARNRSMPKNTRRAYLLRGVIRCGECGRTFCGSQNHGATWYRCDGTLNRTDLVAPRCRAKITKGEYLEPIVWSDIERFLRDPGDILSELEAEAQSDPVGEAMAGERARWENARNEWMARRERLLDLYERGHRTWGEVEERLAPVAQGLAQAEEQLAALDGDERDLEIPPVSVDFLTQIHERLDAGLTDAERAEIVRLLVGITVFTDFGEDGKKTQRALVNYRFPCRGATCTDMGSSPRPKYTRRGRPRCPFAC